MYLLLRVVLCTRAKDFEVMRHDHDVVNEPADERLRRWRRIFVISVVSRPMRISAISPGDHFLFV